MRLAAALAPLLVAVLALVGTADAADYTGPLVDAHGHVPSVSSPITTEPRAASRLI